MALFISLFHPRIIQMNTNSFFLNPQIADICANLWTIRQAATVLAVPYRFAVRVFAFNASVSRLRGGALATSDSRRWCAAWVTSSTARLNASSFACDGFVNPDSFRTNWSDEARISSFVAGGEKLCSVLMARHMKPIKPRIRLHTRFRNACGNVRNESGSLE